MVAAFEVQVDTLMSLRINASDIARLFGSINTGRSSEVISAVVFRCWPQQVEQGAPCLLEGGSAVLETASARPGGWHILCEPF